jgi:hypothetical protein
MNEKAAELIQELVSRYREFLETYQWVWEMDRWREMVFCLLAALDPDKIEIARIATLIFGNLGLLDIDALAGKGSVDLERPPLRLMRDILTQMGYTAETSNVALTTIVEAARGLQAHHQSRVQKYLRVYGERMLAELGQTFAFSALSPDQTHYAFTLWLQNVLNMPIALYTNELDRIARERGLSPEAVVDTADAMDLNLAVLDDLMAAEAAA